MFCILEGVDGGGKSTVANQLTSELESRGFLTQSLHRGVPERDVLEEYQLDVEWFRPNSDTAIVADRWHWGDIVYGELYRGSSYLGGINGGTFRYLELFLRSRGAISVLIENDPQVIIQRLAARGEDYLKTEHVPHVIERYREVFDASATGVAITESPDVDAILKHAEFWRLQAADLAPFPTYIGNRTPRVLLVGDRRSDPDGPSMTAFRPGKGNNGSGAYLLEALPAGLWGEVGICNANEEEDLPALLDVLADPPVIALGHEASKALRKHDIQHAAVPHPAKIKRFHNKQQLNYGQLIDHVIGRDTKEFSWPR